MRNPVELIRYRNHLLRLAKENEKHHQNESLLTVIHDTVRGMYIILAVRYMILYIFAYLERPVAGVDNYHPCFLVHFFGSMGSNAAATRRPSSANKLYVEHAFL